MKILAFSSRNLKEILRDPLNLAFGLGFPLVLIFLLTMIQRNIPVSLFRLDSLTPGVSVFGLSFLTLFAATLVSRDRESALLQRLYTTPLAAWDFILGYILPLVPLALGQCLVCYLAAWPLGLRPGWQLGANLVSMIPVGLFYISLGLLCGSIFTVKQVGGICGAGLTNVSAWLSGIWFDISLVGGSFETISDVLPFRHAVELQRAIFQGNWTAVPLHTAVVAAYTLAVSALAVWLFLRQMGKQ